jgi:hypothetical protein
LSCSPTDSTKVEELDKVFWDQDNLIIKNNLSRKNLPLPQINLIFAEKFAHHEN